MESLIETGQLQQLLGVAVGILAVLMPVAIVFVVLHFRHRRESETLATIRYLAEKGLPVPAELLSSSKVETERRGADPRALSSALSTVGAGIGLMIFFYIWEQMRFLWGVGALIAIVGLAQLLGVWLSRKQAPADAGKHAA